MIRRIVFFLTLLIVLAAWTNARADFLNYPSGHGPLTCSSPVVAKDYGQVEMWNGPITTCERWTGTLGVTGGQGDLLFPSAGMQWAAKSPNATEAYACMAVYHNTYGWCTDLRPITNTWTDFGATPVYIQIGYSPPCPTDSASSFTTIHWCTGNYTPMDPNGLPTAVIGDGHVATGLPYGNPLKLYDADVCIATMANYPSLPHTPARVAAVYTCP